MRGEPVYLPLQTYLGAFREEPTRNDGKQVVMSTVGRIDVTQEGNVLQKSLSDRIN